MSRQDDIAAKAVRKSTLHSIKVKKEARLRKLKEDYEAEVRKINIEYSKDPERLKAKYAAEEYAKNERAKRRAGKKVEKEQKILDMQNALRPFSNGEEIATSIVQGLGFAFAIVALALFDSLAVSDIQDYKNLSIVIYTLFGSSLILMYLCSVFNHALRNYVAKEVFKRLSHVFTFLIIGFGYTAYTLTKIQGLFGWILFGIVWGVAIIGSILYAVFGSRLEKGIVAFYVITGWAGLAAAKVLYDVLSAKSLEMLAAAGIIYIVGLVFYNLRKVKWMHFVGNCIMLSGSIFMFLSLFFINA